MSRDRLIGFDYGEKRIGVAVGQTLTASATALETLHARRGRPDWERIGALIDEWKPDALVVGRPLNMDGSTQALTHAAERFARRLEGRFGLPVHLADERLTTYEARQRGAREGEVDALAAQVILESWLGGHAAPEGGHGRD